MTSRKDSRESPTIPVPSRRVAKLQLVRSVPPRPPSIRARRGDTERPALGGSAKLRRGRSLPPTARPPGQRLPAARGARPVHGAASAALIVDDVAFVRQLVAAALRKDGWHCEEAADVEQALRALARSSFDVVLLDVDLGGTSTGHDLLRQIRADARWDAMPVILVTGTSCEPEAIARGLLGGATDHITKPFDPLVLRARVASAKRSRAALRALHDHASAVADESRTIRTELDDANRMQRAALPEVPLAAGGLLVTGESVAASGVSGDTFDFVVDAQGRASIVLLDAAGHGVASGLVMSACRSAARRALELSRPLDEVMSVMHGCLTSLGGILEAAVAVGILRFSIHEGVVEILNAGLPPIVTVTRAGGLICHPSRSAPVGLLPNPHHPHERAKLCDGDVWMLVSDGLTDGDLDEDAVEELADRIGLPRYRRQLAAADPSDLRALILEWASTRGTKRTDDMTLVIAGRDGDAAEELSR